MSSENGSLIEVSDVIHFTKYLDGATFYKCACGHCSRQRRDAKGMCPSCGWPISEEDESITEQEYREYKK